jgi:hypothetical protein
MKRRYEHLNQETKEWIHHVSRYCRNSEVSRLTGISNAVVGKYSSKDQINYQRANFSYPSLIAAGYKLVSKYPDPIWEKDGVEITLGFDYMPKNINIAGVDIDFPQPVWTIGDLETIIKFHND